MCAQIYHVRCKPEMHENRQYFRTGMEFATRLFLLFIAYDERL